MTLCIIMEGEETPEKRQSFGTTNIRCRYI